MGVDLQDGQRPLILQRLKHGNGQGIITADQNGNRTDAKDLGHGGAQAVTVGRTISRVDLQIPRIHRANPIGQHRAAKVKVHMGQIGGIGRPTRPNGPRPPGAVMANSGIGRATRRPQNHNLRTGNLGKRDLGQPHEARHLARSEHGSQSCTTLRHDRPSRFAPIMPALPATASP